MRLPNFLKLFVGAKMSSVEFEKLKSKVNVAKSVIVTQTGVIAKKDAKIEQLQAEINGLRSASPDITDADYAMISAGLDEILTSTPAAAPAIEATTPPAEPVPAVAPALVDVGGLIHPALQG